MSVLRSLLNLLLEPEPKPPPRRRAGTPSARRVRRIDVKHRGKIRQYRVNRYGEVFEE